MEARQGRDAAGGSMRSTTARPAISQGGRGRPCRLGIAGFVFGGFFADNVGKALSA